MENEEIVEGIPTETTESDDDFFSEVDSEVIAENTSEGEDEGGNGEENNEAQIPIEASDDTPKTSEVDYKPLLDALSGKIKYNKEEVKVESIEDLIENYQKGLNYDKKLQELENLQNSKLEKYAKEKADALGITVDQYMDRVEQYEESQRLQQEQDELNELVEAGMPDTLARELIAVRQQRNDLQKEMAEIKAEREAARKEAEKNKEYEEFMKEFPNVKAEEIPKEVFEQAEKTSLSNAYMKWKMKDLETQLSIAKTNEKNRNSAVGGVTDSGPTNEKHERDFFLEGFLE